MAIIAIPPNGGNPYTVDQHGCTDGCISPEGDRFPQAIIKDLLLSSECFYTACCVPPPSSSH